MKLPNGDQAIIDSRKITEYCLNPDHEDGKHKAKLFRELLGLELDHADQLIDALRDVASNGEAVMGKSDKYGQRYVVDFEFVGPAGNALLRSAWIVLAGEAVPRLVTCYVL